MRGNVVNEILEIVAVVVFMNEGRKEGRREVEGGGGLGSPYLWREGGFFFARAQGDDSLRVFWTLSRRKSYIQFQWVSMGLSRPHRRFLTNGL